MKLHVALCAFLVGCVADPPSLGVTESAVRDNPGGCDDYECGGNSPVMDAVEFYWLSEAFDVENDGGFKITRVLKWGAEYRIDVVDGEVLIKYKTNDAIVARGYNAANTKIEITHAQTNKKYELYISAVGKHPFWAKGRFATNAPTTWTYKLYWKFPPTGNEPPTTSGPSYAVCGESTAPDGLEDFSAVLLDDENIDAETISVGQPRANTFTIGCANHAIAKLHLLGQSKAAAPYLGYTTTLAERQATIKMLSGDYCGGGDGMTIAGMPLKYKFARTVSRADSTPIFDSVGSPSIFQQKVLEARWNQYGAICLDIPRVDYQPGPKPPEFPEGVEDILDIEDGWCTANNPRPPPCTGTYATMGGADIISVNYRSTIVPRPL